MTVAELIEKLKKQPQSAKVILFDTWLATGMGAEEVEDCEDGTVCIV